MPIDTVRSNKDIGVANEYAVLFLAHHAGVAAPARRYGLCCRRTLAGVGEAVLGEEEPTNPEVALLDLLDGPWEAVDRTEAQRADAWASRVCRRLAGKGLLLALWIPQKMETADGDDRDFGRKVYADNRAGNAWLRGMQKTFDLTYGRASTAAGPRVYSFSLRRRE